MGQKIKPSFGSPGEDPETMKILQTVQANISAIFKWAQTVEQKIIMMENALVSYEDALIQINGSLEAACRLLIEAKMMDQEKLHAYAKEYVDAHNELRQEQIKRLTEAMAKEASPIWTPPKKSIITPG